jgi:hypothetical protein
VRGEDGTYEATTGAGKNAFNKMKDAANDEDGFDEEAFEEGAAEL